MTPTVAIIVRTKNRPKFLARTLTNISKQTFSDYTVHVVNDGGDRAEAERVVASSPVAEKTTLLHTEGLGMEAASNLGIAHSESTYIAIHDDDDLWKPEFLTRTTAALEETGANMCTVRIVERFEQETAHGFEVIEEKVFHEGLPIVGLQFLYRTNRVVPIGMIYRRELHQKIGEYRPDLEVIGDWEFNLRAGAAGEIITVDEPLAYWCRRPNSTGAVANSINREDKHRYYDAKVRTEEIRKDINSGGSVGAYLYMGHLTNELDARIEVVLEALGRIEAEQREQGERLRRIEQALTWRNQVKRVTNIFKRRPVKGNSDD